MTDLEEIEPLLYTYDDLEYRERAWTPNYSFEIENTDQYLYYFGANHSRESDNPQYSLLRDYWEDFLEKTKVKDSVVLVEGALRDIHPDEETAILQDSEAGFITFLAHKANVLTCCPEPTRTQIDNHVLAAFPKDELDYYYFARMVSQWNRIPEPRPSIQEYLRKFSFDEMKEVHLKVTGKEFDENDKHLFSLLSDPTKKDNPLHSLIRMFGVYRNAYIVQEIERIWNDGKSIFVVYGGSHGILQERALRKLLS